VDRFGRLTHVVGFNAIAIGGVFFRGWPDGTAVALYWCESLLFVLSVSILVALHRKLTNKSGHYFRRGTYNSSLLVTSFVCALVQIPFLVALLGLFGVDSGVDLIYSREAGRAPPFSLSSDSFQSRRPARSPIRMDQTTH
jgi:hypothetical protein